MFSLEQPVFEHRSDGDGASQHSLQFFLVFVLMIELCRSFETSVEFLFNVQSGCENIASLTWAPHSWTQLASSDVVVL